MWLVAIRMNSADMEHIHHYRTFYWSALIFRVKGDVKKMQESVKIKCLLINLTDMVLGGQQGHSSVGDPTQRKRWTLPVYTVLASTLLPTRRKEAFLLPWQHPATERLSQISHWKAMILGPPSLLQWIFCLQQPFKSFLCSIVELFFPLFSPPA